MKANKKFATAIALVAMLGSAGMATVANAAAADNIDAGGATFPLNLIESCRSTFPADASNTLGASVNYSGVGSGTGRTNFLSGTYKFAMTDSLPSSANNAVRTSYVLLPLIGGAIDVAYNLSGIKPVGTVLQMSPDTTAKIFAGQITTWNNPAIIADNPIKAQPVLSALNASAKFTIRAKNSKTANLAVFLKSSAVPAGTKNLVVTATGKLGKTRTVLNVKPKVGSNIYPVAYAQGHVYTVKYNGKSTPLGTVTLDSQKITLPSTPITVFHRKETSGTTNNFINYLNKAAPSVWTLAAQDAFDIPTKDLSSKAGAFVAAQGNDGVANGVMGKDGGIGYAEVSFVNERLAAGKTINALKIKNGAGEYLAGSSAGAAIAIGAASVNETTGVVTFNYNTTAKGAYPITAVSYAMANTAAATQATAAQNLTAKRFVQFVLNTCAPEVGELKGYTPLPANIVAIAKTLSEKIGA